MDAKRKEQLLREKEELKRLIKADLLKLAAERKAKAVKK